MRSRSEASERIERLQAQLRMKRGYISQSPEKCDPRQSGKRSSCPVQSSSPVQWSSSPVRTGHGERHSLSSMPWGGKQLPFHSKKSVSLSSAEHVALSDCASATSSRRSIPPSPLLSPASVPSVQSCMPGKETEQCSMCKTMDRKEAARWGRHQEDEEGSPAEWAATQGCRCMPVALPLMSWGEAWKVLGRRFQAAAAASADRTLHIIEADLETGPHGADLEAKSTLAQHPPRWRLVGPSESGGEREKRPTLEPLAGGARETRERGRYATAAAHRAAPPATPPSARHGRRLDDGVESRLNVDRAASSASRKPLQQTHEVWLCEQGSRVPARRQPRKTLEPLAGDRCQSLSPEAGLSLSRGGPRASNNVLHYANGSTALYFAMLMSKPAGQTTPSSLLEGDEASALPAVVAVTASPQALQKVPAG